MTGISSTLFGNDYSKAATSFFLKKFASNIYLINELLDLFYVVSSQDISLKSLTSKEFNEL